MTRQIFDNQIQQLRQAVVAMASMVDKAIAWSVDALKYQQLDLAQQIVTDDRKINEVRWDIEQQALLLIATQGPIAGDLRLISAAIHIATELERMADHAAGNAKLVLQTADEPLLKPLVDIPRMADVCRSMLGDSITAFINADVDAARAIVKRDDDVDALYDQIYRELLTYMMADPATISRATHLLWVSHNLERIADRVTNVCERIVFASTGALEDLEATTY